MISHDENKISIQGSITIANVTTITQQGITLLNDSHLVIDLASVTDVDSSAVGMLLEWLRSTKEHKQPIQFINIPDNLDSLIQLYGVSELIPRASSTQQVN